MYHVCVDKPLAENVQDAERLIELAEKRKRTLMVGFNRRFAPLYQQLKAQLPGALPRCGWINTVPTAWGRTICALPCWMIICTWWIPRCGWPAASSGWSWAISTPMMTAQMVYAEHHLAVDHLQITTSMHRRAGSQRESVQAVTDGALYDITDMREWREEKGSGVAQ